MSLVYKKECINQAGENVHNSVKLQEVKVINAISHSKLIINKVKRGGKKAD